MDVNHKQAFIRQKAFENMADPIGKKVLWSRLAITEVVNDGIDRHIVESALTSARVIEDHPLGTRLLPDCLIVALLRNEQPLHAVVAIDLANDRILMIIVYLPSEG